MIPVDTTLSIAADANSLGQEGGNYNDFPYDDFPIHSAVTTKAGDATSNSRQLSDSAKEIFLSGQLQNYCVCYIDMINSTMIAAELSNNDEEKIGKYYALFLNAMSTIAKDFDAEIIKNAGDCLIYYFPQTSNPTDESAFREVFECNFTMIAAHPIINTKLRAEKLPPLNYRISADYGRMEVATSTASRNSDLFGSPMNLCAKINSKASPNGLVIGSGLYQAVRSFSFFDKEYSFEKVCEYMVKSGYPYSVYSVASKKKRYSNIINPFTRISG